MEREFPAYYQLKHQKFTVSPRQLQGMLNAQTAVIEYTLTDSSLYTYTLTNHSFQQQVKRLDSTFFQQVQLLKESILNKDDALYRQVAYALYEQLWPKTLPVSIQQVILIPDGTLLHFPFEALLTRKDNKKKALGDPLIQQYAINYAYSATLLHQQLSQSIKPKLPHLLALAPVFNDTHTNTPSDANRMRLADYSVRSTAGIAPQPGWLKGGRYVAPLPASAQEVASIAQLVQRMEGVANVYVDGQAKEESLKADSLLQYSYIHIATHGLINEERPELSGLILAQDSTSQEDGILYAGEIYNLRFNADLVTLSACQTGLGKLIQGEGIIGLSRALLYAGAKNVAVSLWQVSDQSTAVLMKEFYKQMLKGKGKAQALRLAKLHLLKHHTYQAPYYWAPFVLIGY